MVVAGSLIGLLCAYQLHVQTWEASQKPAACDIASSWLLTQARNIKVMRHAFSNQLNMQSGARWQICAPLQVLYANVARLDTLGRARGIRHLMLDIPDVECTALSSTLSVLGQLQTLWLSSHQWKPPTAGRTLQLKALLGLKSLALDGLVPDSIHLNGSCELHVSQWGLVNISHTVWDTVLPHLRSVTLRDDGYEMTSLPSILRNASNLTRAAIHVRDVGTSGAPLLLDGALAGVVDLSVLCTGGLHAVVPADVTWRHVSLNAFNTLALRFEDLLSFAEGAPAFCFSWGHLGSQVCPDPVGILSAGNKSAPDLLCAAGVMALSVGRCPG